MLQPVLLGAPCLRLDGCHGQRIRSRWFSCLYNYHPYGGRRQQTDSPAYPSSPRHSGIHRVTLRLGGVRVSCDEHPSPRGPVRTVLSSVFHYSWDLIRSYYSVFARTQRTQDIEAPAPAVHQELHK